MDNENNEKKQPFIELETYNISRDTRYSYHKQPEESTSSTLFTKLETKYKTYIPYYYMMFSAIFMSCNALCAKFLERFPPFELLFVRSLVVFILLFFYIKYYNSDIVINDKKNKRLILLQSFFQFIFGFCYFYGICNMPLSEAIVIIHTSPMFTGLLSWILLGNHYSLNEKISAGVTLLGIILIIRPSFLFGEGNLSTDLYQKLKGGLFCLLGSLLLSLNGMTIQITGRLVHPITMVLFAVLISTFLSPIVWLLFEEKIFPKGTEIMLFILMGFFYFIGQFFMVKSFQISEKVSLVNYLQMIFAFIFDIFVIKDIPEIFSIIGSLLIVFSCLYIIGKLKRK